MEQNILDGGSPGNDIILHEHYCVQGRVYSPTFSPARYGILYPFRMCGIVHSGKGMEVFHVFMHRVGICVGGGIGVSDYGNDFGGDYE